MQPIQILVMCTANICRSPLAEQYLAAGLAAAGVPAQLSSAGFLESGRRIDRRSALILAERGIDAKAHVSTEVSPELIDAADLVVVMTAEHLRRLVGEDASRFPKVFTLRDLVGCIATAGPRADGEDPRAWIARISQGRNPQSFLGSGTELDVTDPYQVDDEAYGVIAAEIDGLVSSVVDGFCGRFVAPPVMTPAEPERRRRFFRGRR
jgi:protein-tyrosine phosphatase